MRLFLKLNTLTHNGFGGGCIYIALNFDNQNMYR